ncbi:DUF3006 domain-containing protein [Intestinibacillus massiliensis]|uniref:DUF3006 domain-containing protein n=1 Tax=Intestinibacillus massiliensis TaxID=1871029 RepID=UPI000B35C621|nr:DUF3006 domain-containing protein [Intestinibacillus massiliensis]MCB6366710.1 DUF3006 domain-containing protein [Intestinibacillus massiliensis]
MKKIATVDRFEGEYVVLETDDGMINIPRANAPEMLGEGMVVEYEGDHVLRIDLEETARREDELRRRFERILGKKD